MSAGARSTIGPLAHFPPPRAVLGFGAWAVGGRGWGAPEDEGRRIGAIRAALEGGVRFFDTAPTYGDSESLLGRALADARETVALATKVGPRDDPAVSLEGSLRRLGVERVDLVQLHEPGPSFEERLEALGRLVEAGKAAGVGLCNATHRQIARALDIVPLAAYQGPYNLVDREAQQREIPLCSERGIGFLAYRPLAAGLLAGRFGSGPEPAFPEGDHRRTLYWFRGRELERRREVLGSLADLAAQTGRTLAQVALGWVLAQRGVAVVLAGARTPEQVRENLGAIDHPLTPEQVGAVDAGVAAAYRPARATPAALAASQSWGERERFVIERLDGQTSCETIAAAWNDRDERPIIAAQVRVLADHLHEEGLVTYD